MVKKLLQLANLNSYYPSPRIKKHHMKVQKIVNKTFTQQIEPHNKRIKKFHPITWEQNIAQW